MTTKGRYYMTPGGYKLDVDNHGNVSLTEPGEIRPSCSSKAVTVLELSVADISELAAMFDEAARDLQPETSVGAAPWSVRAVS